MALPINTLRSRAHQFVLDHQDDVKENAEAQSFLNDFFAIFDIKRKTVGSFELAVKTDGDQSSKRLVSSCQKQPQSQLKRRIRSSNVVVR